MIDERSVTDADFNTIFETHKDAVHRFAWRMTCSPEISEDVTQDCFVALLRAPERYDSRRGSMLAFLIGMARNQILKRWRSENRWVPYDDEAIEAEPLELANFETAELVQQAMQRLPPLQREAILLAEYEGMMLEEIATAVGIEVGAVKARLHRARGNLRRMLEPLRKPTCL